MRLQGNVAEAAFFLFLLSLLFLLSVRLSQLTLLLSLFATDHSLLTTPYYLHRYETGSEESNSLLALN